MGPYGNIADEAVPCVIPYLPAAMRYCGTWGTIGYDSQGNKEKRKKKKKVEAHSVETRITEYHIIPRNDVRVASPSKRSVVPVIFVFIYLN